MPRKKPLNRNHRKKKLLLESFEDRILCNAAPVADLVGPEEAPIVGPEVAHTTTTVAPEPVLTAAATTTGSQEGLSDEQRAAIQSVIRDSTEKIFFEKNVGQFDEGVRYGFKTKFGSMMVLDDSLRITTNQKDMATGNVGVHVVDITFPGSGNDWQIVPGESSGVAGSYHLNGTTLTPDIYTEITLEGVFNGVDLRLYSAENGILEFDWLVAKAQDYSQIRMQATGQDGIIFNEDGSATLDLRFQDLALKIPEVYQVIDGAKHAVGARMVAGETAGEIRYELSGNVIPDQPLVIDPSVAWSTYFDLDTTFDAYVFAAAVNANGVYAIGWVGAAVTNAAHGTYMQVPAGFSQGTAANQDYIYRFDNTGTNITAWTSTLVVSSTGTVSNQTLADQASDLELFPDGRVLAAYTSGRVQIYSANLATQQYSSEPIGVEVLNSVAIASNDVFYTSGRVNAALAGVPVTGPDTTMAGTTEGYIIRFSGASTAAGTAGLTGDWATYIGGDNLEYFTAISITPDRSRIVFATVSIAGAGYSGLVNAVDSTLGAAGTYEILTGVINEQAAAPAAFNVFSYFGGSSNEGSVVGTLDRAAVQVTANNTDYYVAGNTNSADLPGRTAATGGVANGAQTGFGGGAFDMFAALIPLTGSAGSGYQSTYLGGAGEDNIGGIAYDSRAGKLLVFGTSNGSFPTQDTSPAGSLFYQGTAGGGLDIVVGTLSGNLQTKEFATYIGGTSNDYLGQTGELVGQGHIVYSEVTGLAYLATTVHSALSGPVMGLVPGKDKTKSNGTNDSHFIIAFNANTHDFGDAPASYDGGNAPSEAVTIQMFLGTTVDAEASPFTSANADGDDLTNSGAADDEDALTSASPLYLGASTYSITVPLRNTNGAAATLNGWIDFNSNGAFEAGEFATDVVNNGDTTGTLTWSVPTTFTLGQSFMRLRLSNNTLTDNAGTAGVDERSIGLGVVGEIEDYAITFAGATVSGTVYRDNDNDGTIDGGETGIGGVSIQLTGTNDLGAPVSVTTSTLVDGTYSFTGLRPSNGAGYTVTETQPAGFLDGRNTVGSAGGATTNTPPTDIISGALVTTPGLVASGYNFGELNPASLSGFVYADVNGNGAFGAGETGIPGATVTLTGTNDLGAITPIVATTDSTGAYTFTNLRPGTYVITETQPVNYNDGAETLGTGLTAPNSAGTTGADVFTAITFASVASGNEVGTGYNFGEAPNFNPTKSLQTTSDGTTAGTNVAIGEIATFRLVATIPAGSFANFQLQDVLPAGYQFINGSAVVGLVSAAGQLTSTTITAPLTAIGTPSVALGDLAVSSLSGSNNDTYVSGTDVFFKLGDITNADTDNGTTEFAVIEFQARVLDEAGNTSGTTLGNTFNVLFDTNNTPLTAETFGGGSNTITSTVVEPRLQITKAASDTTPGINDLLTFTLTITHTGASTQAASDIRIFDALPTGLTIEGAVIVSGATATSTSTAGNTLDVTLDTLAVAGTATITFTARVTNSLATVGTTIDNNARLYWDSLAADEASNAVFDNAADGTPDRDYGAVFGATEAFGANTDNAQDTERLVVNTNSITGLVYEDANSSGGYNVGEPLISGVQLTLTGTTAGGLAFSQNATTVAGVYTFTNIPAGANYTITETQPPVYSDGAETAGTPFGGNASAVPGVDTITNIAIAADSSQSGTGYNFGELLVSSISGTVYRDNNNNGAINGGETGIGTITVRLTGIDNALNPVNRTTTTAPDGTYSFGSVVAGTYTVSLDTQPAGFLDGTDTAGTSGGTAGAVGTDSISAITLPAGTNATSYNFGELNPASLSGNVYGDLDTDGVFDGFETGIPGATVTLTGTNDLGAITPIVVVSGAGGAYSFTNLRPGTYAITETQPTGYSDGAETLGTGLTAPNSTGAVGADTFTGIVFSTVAAGNTSGVNYNFGESPNFGLTKSLQATSLAATTGANLVVGEIATFRLVATIPAGSFTDFQIQDALPAGYVFLNNNTAVVSLVSSAGQLTSSTLSGAGLAQTSVGTPTFVLPDAAVSTSTTVNADVYASGTDVFFKLGNLTNTDTDGGATESVVIEFQAMVTNEIANQAGSTLDNSFSVLFDKDGNPGPEPHGPPAPPVTSTIAEPNVTISKTADITSNVDAGDVITYTVTLTNPGGATGSTAFDTLLVDTMPANLLVTGITSTTLNGGATSDSAAAIGGGGTSITGQYDIPAGGSVVVVYTATVQAGFAPNGSVTNAAVLTWTSLNGGNSTAPDANERFGDAGSMFGDGSVNDFRRTTSVTTTGAGPTFSKVLFSTSDAGTTGSNVGIGETVTYGLLVTLPEGTTNGLSAADVLPPGLQYTGFSIVTTAAASNGLLTANFNGTVPAPTVTGGATDGADVNFAFGAITTAGDNVTTNNTFLILVNTVVTDIPANSGLAPQTVLPNSATFTGTGIPPTTPPTVNVTLTEPRLQIAKGVDDATADLGQTLTYTLMISHTASSTAPAYDLILRDAIPAGMTLNVASIAIAGGTIATNTSTASQLALTVDELATGGTITITYTATVGTGAALVGTNLDNNARIFWDSLADDAGSNAVFTNVADGTSDRDFGATFGYVEAATPAPDDAAQDTVRVSVNGNTISGTVYGDTDASGTLNGAETGINNVALTLSGTTFFGVPYTQNTTTSPTGAYSFTNVPRGTYTITETQPAGFVDGVETVGTTFGGTVSAVLNADTISALTVPAGVNTGTGYNFGELLGSSLSGTTYQDLNNDGLINGVDTTLNGVTIGLTGTDVFGQAVSFSTTTAGAGAYAFANLRPGTYTITETQPAGFNDGIDTQGTPGTGTAINDAFQNITLAVNTNGTGNNFGELPTTSISGTVYLDNNNNGAVNVGETGIQTVTVTLTGLDDLGATVNMSTTTDVDGNYTFSGLRPSSAAGYTVTETQPVGFLDGLNTFGTSGGTAGNPPPGDAITGIVLTAGAAATGYNFGELNPASLSGSVYADVDADGVFDVTESGIAGVTVTLTGTNDLGAITPIVATTGAGGTYSFTNLRPGTYAITETQPTGFTDGAETLGTGLTAPNSAGTVGADTFAGVVFSTVAAGNTSGVNYNFGEAPAIGLSKSIVSTSVGGDTSADVVIGEVVRFRLVATVPSGSYANFQLRDILPAGYQFLDNGNARAGLVSAAGQLTATGLTAPLTALTTPTVALADNSVSTSATAEDDTYLSGTDVFFKLGTLTNADTDFGTTEAVVIEFDALVVNEIGNQSGAALANSLQALFDKTNDGIPDDDALLPVPVTSTVTEPRMALDKGVTPFANLQAGNTVTYTLTLSNLAVNGATAAAFDALILDAMPAGVLITSIDDVSFPVSVTQDSAVTITGGGTGLSGQFDIPIDGTVTITYTGTLQTSVNPGTNYTNTATLTYSSTNGVNPNERTGLPSDPLNDYQLTDTAVIGTTNTFVLDKTSPAGPIAVGDTIPYTLTLTLLEGTTPNVQIVDALPAGLQFTAGSVVVTNGAGMSTGFVSEGASVSVVGQNVTFDLGSVVNPAGGGNTVTITFNALVLDSAANSTTTAPGQTKTNTATATGTGVPPSIDTRDVQFVEPRLVVTKGVDDATPDINQVVTYTVNVSHAATSGGTAYDIRVRDLLPAGLDLDEATLTITSGTATINAGSNLSAGNLLDFTLNQLAVGESVTFTYQATVVNTLATAGTSQSNNVRLYWDTQAADEPTNAIFAGVADGTNDRDYGATPGYTEAGTPAPDDDAQDTVTLTVNANSIAGTVYRDNDGSGTFNGGDTTLDTDVRLTGTTSSGLAVDITLTTVGGAYSFANLPAGIYTLTETQPLGHTDGLETIGSAFGGAAVISNVVGSNTITGITIPTQGVTSATGYNFGETLASSLAGQVYRDYSNNGVVNVGEPGINGVTVTLTGTDIYGVAVNETLITAGDGDYTFNSIGGLAQGLRPGNYTITEVAGAALTPYLDGIDAGGTLAGTAPQFDALSTLLAQNTAGTGYTFGELDPASISGSVYIDADNDGARDANEPGINNVAVRIQGLDDRGNSVDVTINTDVAGNYSFTGLRPGTYSITEPTQPSGYADGTDSVGTGLSGGGNNVGTAGNDTITGINIVNVAPGNNAGVNYSFGERFNPELGKSIVTTSEVFTGPVLGTERVALGEIIRYHLVVQAVESTLTDFTIREVLPAGMQFINDGSATLALVSNGGLTSSFGFGGSQVAGSSGAVTPDFQISGNNISSDIANTADVYGSGSAVYFHLGDITNTDADANSEYFVIEFNARVLNEAGNQAGTTLTNTFDVLFDLNGSGATDDTELAATLTIPLDVVVAESNLVISKALVSATTPTDAGDQVTYRITLTNNASGDNAAAAFDVRVLDLLDAIGAGNASADLELINTTLGSGITITASSGATVASNNSTASQLDLVLDRLNVGETVTVDIVTRVVAAAPAGATLTNSVTADFTSLPGTGTGLLVNTNNGPVTSTSGGERTGSDIPNPTDNTGPTTGVLNNYAVGATIPVGDVRTTDTPTIDKQFGATSEAGTAGTSVAIGEMVTFNIVITLPEGTTQGVIITDTMQAGFEFISAALDFTGSGVVPFALGAPVVTGNANTGTQLVYSLGTLTNAGDNNAGNNSFTLAVTARVADIAGNVDGVTRSNSANLQFTDPDGPTVVTVPDPNGDPSVTIVEPQLQIAKTADDTTPDLNQVVTYTLVINHTAAGSSDAYDVRIRDLIPHGVGTGLILDTASITVNGLAATTSPLVASNATAGDQLDLTLSQVLVGETITITYQARVENTLANIGTLADNNARIYWDSTAADEADNAVFNNTPDLTPDRDYGATPGLTEAFNADVDAAQDGERITVNTNTITGVVYRDADTSGSFTGGDVRLDAVTVRLTGTTASGLAVDITTQTVNGDYTFAGLSAGTYVITETQPVGLTDGVENAGVAFGGTVSNALGSDTISAITIPAGSAVTGTGYDFGEVNPSSFAGSVYHDLDNDGFRDALETGVASSIQITGTDAFGEAVNTTVAVTDGAGDGRFLLDGLRPGNYTLTQVLQPVGYLDGKDTAGTSGGTADSLAETISNITLTQGTSATNYIFGEVIASTLSGNVYLDLNNDGAIAVGESPISGVLITLSGTDDRGNPVSGTFNTLVDGTFTFGGLRPGNYTLTETQPAAYSDGLETAGSLGATVGNDTLSNITTTSGDVGTAYNFGERGATVSGNVFRDLDRAGDLDAGTDTGIGGVTLTLRDSGDNIVATTTSNPDGTYQFTDLPAGDYTIVQTQPLGYGSSTPNTVAIAVPIGGLSDRNFGETLSTFSGLVFRDDANDGIFNGTDEGIGAVVLRITGTDAAGNPVDRTTTSAGDGTYTFGDLLSGTYTIRETQPVGYDDGIDTLGTLGGTLGNDIISAITMPVATDATGYNFADIIQPQPPGLGAISGTVFRDADRDGTLDAGDTGIGSVALQLLDSGGNVVATTTTAGDGKYTFGNILAGTYSVRETQPNGYGSSTPNTIAGIVVVANQTVTDQLFGETTSGLSGKVFTDLDKDGVFTVGEPGISGVTLTLTGTDVNSAAVSATTITDSNGDYAFDGLIAGTYRIVETQPTNRADGLDHVGTSGGTAENDVLRNIALNADILATGYNFGELLPTLSGTVFRDDNTNGTLTVGEPGIGGVTLTLRDSLNNVIATTTSGADGTYEFLNVLPGDYTVTETQPAGYGNSSPNVLSVTATNADVSGINFGETTSSLAGTVFRDVDNSATLTAGDAGIGGVAVRLTGVDAQGNVIDIATTTNPDGTYLFDRLLGGTYFITETQPSGFDDGAESVGTAGGDGNINDVFGDIGLGNGFTATGYNFAETITTPPGQGAITGVVWLDQDRDAALDGGEPGIGGVLIELVDGGNNVVGSAFTGADGHYTINGIAPGTYTVRQVQPAGYGSSTANSIAAVAVVADTVMEDVSFGETLGSIAGTVFRDVNNNGVQLGVAETGIAGVTITLSGFDINDTPVLRTIVTDANGNYVFTDVLASNAAGYTITETQPAAFNDGLDALGSLNGTLANDSASNIVLTVTGNNVTDATGYTFGEQGTTLTGNVWVDRDRDGIREPATEPNGLAGVLITLLDANGDLVATTTTNAAGDYTFSNVDAGDYTIVQTQPNGYGSSTLNVVNVTVPTTGLADQNFGETASTISGLVFRDDNFDGAFNGSDDGIAGVEVRLAGTDANGAAVSVTTTTDVNGNYVFIDLLEGNYTITETQPDDYSDGADLIGSVGGLNLINDRISSIGLGSGQDVTDYSFGEIFRFDPEKILISTSNPGTSGANVSIGETIRFRLLIALPDSGLNDFVLAEYLPKGLVFLNDGTAAVAFLSNSGTGLASSTLSGPGLGVTHDTFAPTVLLSDAQVSSSSTANEDIYRSGTSVFFKLGNITNNETQVGDPDREFVFLEFNARVVNETRNQNGHTMDNTFAPRFDLTGDGVNDPLPPSLVSPPTRTVVAEPILSLDKQITAGPKAPKPGDVITFTVTIRHAGDSQATAWESLFSDTLPKGMTLVSISTQGKGGAVITKAASANGLSITGQFDIPVGGSVTITYQVRIGATVKGGTTLTNGADVTWTSMPGDQPTERKSGDSLLNQGGLNDYELVAKSSVKITAPPQTNTAFFWDGFNKLGYPTLEQQFSPYPFIPSDNDIYRPAILPLQPIYAGEADPGSTLVLTMFNSKGESIGTQTVIVDSGGNWLATFPSTTIRDTPNTVQISQLSAYYSIGSGVGHNLRTYYSPALNAGHFFYQSLVSVEVEVAAPLLNDLQMRNPINAGAVKYSGEVLASQGAARGY